MKKEILKWIDKTTEHVRKNFGDDVVYKMDVCFQEGKEAAHLSFYDLTQCIWMRYDFTPPVSDDKKYVTRDEFEDLKRKFESVQSGSWPEDPYCRR